VFQDENGTLGLQRNIASYTIAGMNISTHSPLYFSLHGLFKMFDFKRLKTALLLHLRI